MRVPSSPEMWLRLDEVPSTQEAAAELLTSGRPERVVIARRQTAGRGRRGREWHSPTDACLAASIVFDGCSDSEMPWLLGMTIAVAAARALHAQVQWPNDLVLRGRKLGGILTELHEHSGVRVPIVGVGVNLAVRDFPAELVGRAISLHEVDPHPPGPTEALQLILEECRRLPEPRAWPDLEAHWLPLDATPGKRFVLESGEQGTAVGIGPLGQLIVEVDGQKRECLAADALLGLGER